MRSFFARNASSCAGRSAIALYPVTWNARARLRSGIHMCLGALLGMVSLASDCASAQSKSPENQPTEHETRKVKLSGSVRLRYEALNGQFRPGFDAKDDLVSVRTTVLAEYDSGPFHVGAELYDSRAYDTDSGSVLGTSEVNTLELVQAYVALDVSDVWGSRTDLRTQFGRFTMNLGSRRLVAADDYRNTTNGYTGIRADLKMGSAATATLFYTLPQQRRPDALDDLRNNHIGLDREGFDLKLWGGFVSKPKVFGKTLAEIAYVRLQESDRPSRPTRNRNLHSISARLILEPATHAVDYEVEGIYQFGSIRSGMTASATLLDVSAHFLHADLGYSFAGGWKPRVSLEFDYASGDGRGKSFTRFDTLFGMRRADLAPAGIYAALGRTNLITTGLRAEVTPTKKIDAFASARALWSASAIDSFSTTGIRDATGGSGRFAGYQVEGRVRYWLIPKKLRAELNAALLIKQGILVDAPNAPPFGNTRYASIALSYQL